jgi:hypothetical protein
MNAPDQAAGRKVKCAKCSSAVDVPASTNGAAPGPKAASGPTATALPVVAAHAPVEAYRNSPQRMKQILQELSPGEQLIWAGRPSLVQAALGCLGPILLYAVVGLVIFLGAVGSQKTSPSIVATLVLLLGAYFLYSTWVLSAGLLKAGRALYALTDRRALVWEGGLLWAGVESYTPAQLRTMFRRNSWIVANSGHLVFRTSSYLRRRSGGGMSVNLIYHGFLAVPHLEDVEKLVRKTLLT